MKIFKILFIIAIVTLVSGCSKYEVDESIETPVNFRNTTDEELSVDITLIDVMPNREGLIQKEELALLPNEEKGLLHLHYVESKELLLFIEIFDNKKNIYTYASKYPGKNITFIVLDDPIRIEKEDL